MTSRPRPAGAACCTGRCSELGHVLPRLAGPDPRGPVAAAGAAADRVRGRARGGDLQPAAAAGRARAAVPGRSRRRLAARHSSGAVRRLRSAGRRSAHSRDLPARAEEEQQDDGGRGDHADGRADEPAPAGRVPAGRADAGGREPGLRAGGRHDPGGPGARGPLPRAGAPEEADLPPDRSLPEGQVVRPESCDGLEASRRAAGRAARDRRGARRGPRGRPAARRPDLAAGGIPGHDHHAVRAATSGRVPRRAAEGPRGPRWAPGRADPAAALRVPAGRRLARPGQLAHGHAERWPVDHGRAPGA